MYKTTEIKWQMTRGCCQSVAGSFFLYPVNKGWKSVTAQYQR